jgi:hypothetical protein
MGSLRPIGSEKLQGMDKIKRIIEISRYNEHIPNPVNEIESKEYSRSLADGNRYEIVKERLGYIIKNQISEGVSEYIDQMKHRKYYPSYSQALKRLNLMAKELNVLHENRSEVSMFGEEKKYYLKRDMMEKLDMDPNSMDELDEQAPVPSPAPAPAPAPAPVASPAPAPAPEEMPVEPEGEFPSPEEGMEDDEMDNEEEVTFKSIQKLTGKLAQKIRDFDSKGEDEDESMDSNDVKYVINSILSSLDLSVLDDDDVDEILSRFEDEEEGMPSEDGMDIEEPMEPSPEGEEEGELPPPAEGEMSEMENLGGRFIDRLKGAYASSIGKKLPGMGEMFDEDDMEDFDMEDDKFSMGGNFFDDEDEENEFSFEDEEEDEDDHTMRGARKHRRMYDDEGHLSHGTFGESKVDKIIKKYFEIDDKEKQLNEEKRRQELRNHISETRSEIKRLSETISQERMSVKFLSENKKARLIGITNKKNLVFKLNENQVKISPKGNIL